MLLSEIIYIEEQISKLSTVSSNYMNYIPLLRPIYTVGGWLGLLNSREMADIGRRRYSYHNLLQKKLKQEISLGIDKPWYSMPASLTGRLLN